MKVAVIGAGAWGTALAITSARGGSDVILWSYDGNFKEFDDVNLPGNITVTDDITSISDCEAWLIVTPAAYFRETLQKAKKSYKNQPIIICTKGAENKTGDFMSEIITTEMPSVKDYGVLSGPQFATEVAKGIPTGSTLAGTKKVIEIGQKILNKLYITPSNDVIGAEMCGVGKNAVALICGYNSVAASGENERAMILTLAWNEVMKIGISCGAKIETFLDLCGIGDLFLSATSVTSRNFSGGVSIARGLELSGTIEGIFALSGLINRAQKNGIETPILIDMRKKMKI